MVLIVLARASESADSIGLGYALPWDFTQLEDSSAIVKSLARTDQWEPQGGNWFREPAKEGEKEGTGQRYKIEEFPFEDQARVAHVINKLARHAKLEAPESKMALFKNQVTLARTEAPAGHKQSLSGGSEHTAQTAAFRALVNAEPNHFTHTTPKGEAPRTTASVAFRSNGSGLHQRHGAGGSREGSNWEGVSDMLSREHGLQTSPQALEGAKNVLKISNKHLEDAVASAGFSPESADHIIGKLKERRESIRQLLARGAFSGSRQENAKFAGRFKPEAANSMKRTAPVKAGEVGSPPTAKNPAQLFKLKQRLRDLVQRGGSGEGWYRESANKIAEVAGGDPEATRKIAALHAIYSPRYSPIPNSEAAIRAYQHWKTGGTRDELRGGHTDTQEEKARALLYNNHWHEGIKTNAFYRNLMTELTHPDEAGRPPKEGEIQPATIDVWIARAMGYPVGGSTGGPERGVSDSQYHYSQRLLNEVAREHGISAHRAQARMWVAMKAGELSREREIYKYAKEKGELGDKVMEDVGGVGATKAPKALRDRLAHVEQHPDPRSQGLAEENFAHGIEATRGHVISALTPSPESGMIGGIGKAKLEALHELHGRLMGALHDDKGRFIPAELAGIGGMPAEKMGPHGHIALRPFMPRELITQAQREGIHETEGKNAAELARNAVMAKHATRVRGVASAMAHMLGLKHVDYQRPMASHGLQRKDLNAVSVNSSSTPITPEEMAGLQKEVATRTGHDDVMPVPHNNGAYFVNRSDNVSNEHFHKIVRDAAEGMFNRPQLGLFAKQGAQRPDLTTNPFLAHGGRVENDYGKDKQGEGHRRRAVKDLGPALSGRIFSELAPRLRAVYEEWAQKHGHKLNLPEAYRLAEQASEAAQGADEQKLKRASFGDAGQRQGVPETGVGLILAKSSRWWDRFRPSIVFAPLLAKSLTTREEMVHAKHHNVRCRDHLSEANSALRLIGHFADIETLHKSEAGDIADYGAQVAQHLGSAAQECVHVVKHLKRTKALTEAKLATNIEQAVKELIEKHARLMRWLADREVKDSPHAVLEKMFAVCNAAYTQMKSVCSIALEWCAELDALLPEEKSMKKAEGASAEEPVEPVKATETSQASRARPARRPAPDKPYKKRGFTSEDRQSSDMWDQWNASQHIRSILGKGKGRQVVIVLAKAASREDAIRQVAALRNTSGRTPEEATTAHRLADKLEEKHDLKKEASTTPYDTHRKYGVTREQYARVHKFYAGNQEDIRHYYESVKEGTWGGPQTEKSAGAAKHSPEYIEETQQINENKKTWGNRRHKFKRAKWTWPNMHPRCILCGDEPSDTGYCSVQVEKSAHKLHYKTQFQGLPISIENQKGSYRHWYDPHNDTRGRTLMHYPYGYVRLTEGADGDQVDCYLGPNKDASQAFVVHQMKAPDFKEYDEDKVMLGFDSAEEAKAAYLKQYNKPGFFGSMSTIPMGEFRQKLFATKDNPGMIRSFTRRIVGFLTGTPRTLGWDIMQKSQYWEAPAVKIHDHVYSGGPKDMHYNVLEREVPKEHQDAEHIETGFIGHDNKYYERNHLKHLAAAHEGVHPENMGRPDTQKQRGSGSGRVVFTPEEHAKAKKTMATEHADNESRRAQHAAFVEGLKKQQQA